MKRNCILILFFLTFSMVLNGTERKREDYKTILRSLTNTGNDLSLGTIDGRFDVSQLGGASYTMAIEAPLGLPGIQPSVSLVYNSQGGNDIAGFGCSIRNGLPVITRSVRSIFYDGIAKGIAFDSTDAFSVDGQRMFCKSGVEGQDGSVYCTESDPFVNIILHRVTSVPNNYVWFEIQGEDGTVYQLGKNENSRQDLSFTGGMKQTQTWYTNRMENNTGNYLTMTYLHDSLYVYPSQLKYSTNALDTAHSSYIAFSYANRYDKTDITILGNKVCMRKILTGITTGTGAQVYRTYSLEYEQDNSTMRRFSRLSNVTVSPRSDISTHLSPTTLDWCGYPEYSSSSNTLPVNLVPSSKSLQFLSTPQYLSADFNGDGISDILRHVQVREESGNHYNYCWFYLSTKQGSHIDYNRCHLFKLSPDIYFNDCWHDVCTSPMTGDFDGDGLEDLAIPDFSLVYSKQLNSLILYGKNISSGVKDTMALHYVLKNQSSSVCPLYAAADFNNDGRTDVFLMEASMTNGKYACCLFSGSSSFYETTKVEFSLSAGSAPKKAFVADLNANGMLDIIVLCSNGYTIFWNNGNGISATSFTDGNSYCGTGLHDFHKTGAGDFNGDGLIDFLVCDQGDTYWYTYINNGNGTFYERTAFVTPQIYEQSSSSDDNQFCLRTADFNGDGLSDVFIAKAMYGIWTTDMADAYWFLSDGGSFSCVQSSSTYSTNDAFEGNFMLGSFSGRGLVEIANYGFDCSHSTVPPTTSSPQMRCYPFTDYGPETGKISSVTNGLGREIAVHYGSMTDGYTYQAGVSSYPVISPMAPMSLVDTVLTYNGEAGISTVAYRYEGLKFQQTGKGLMGMSKITVNDLATGVVTVNQVCEWDTCLYIPQKTICSQTVGGASSTSGRYLGLDKKYMSGHCAYTVERDSMIQLGFDGEKTTHVQHYDTIHGTLSSEEVVSEGCRKRTDYNYVYTGGAYRPSTITYTGKHPDDADSYIRQTTCTYDEKGRVSQRKEHATSTLYLTTAFNYDDYGNVLTENRYSSEGQMEPPSVYTYDNTHRFITSVTKTVSLPVLSYTHDTWGNVLSETQNSNGQLLVTTHEYDPWDRITLTRNPDGSSVSMRYMGMGTDYYVYSIGTGTKTERTRYDCAGHEIEQMTIGPGSVPVYSNTYYNESGKVASVEHIHGDNEYTETYTYDLLGRIIRYDLGTGPYTTYNYGKLKVWGNENGTSYETHYDGWGNVVSSRKGSVTVTNTYNSQGLPVMTASSADSQPVVMTYNDKGGRLTLSDPDAGTMSYVYDALGRIKSQTDARGIVTSYSYNANGLLQQVAYGTEIVNYTYNTTGYNLGKVSNINYNQKYLYYQYDSLGRIANETYDMHDGFVGSYHYTYNNVGQLATKSYPAGSPTVNYSYDPYGYMNSFSVNGTTVWAFQRRPDGFHEVDSLGTSLLLKKTFDRQGRLLDTAIEKNGQNQILHQLTFVYDTIRSNILTRTGMFPQQETFTYDGLDRLTMACTTADTLQTTYLPNGNIATKTGIGNYYYESAKPHAVTGIDNTGWLVRDARQIAVYNQTGKLISLNEGGKSLTINYGPDGNRWKGTYTAGYGPIVTRYLGDYEETVDTTGTLSICYLGNNALYITLPNGTEGIYYMFTDHLGSITRIYDAAGTEVFSASYDAWGRQTVTRDYIGFRRGYTGHEHLPAFGLINMNGRLYDPILGRFLSTDNYVQEPNNAQNFNRYSYCLNNPLKYTDPSGDFIFSALAAMIMPGLVPLAMQIDQGWMLGGVRSVLGGGSFESGALKGFVGATIETALFSIGGNSLSFMHNLGLGAIQGALSAGFNSMIWNENPTSNLLSGTVSGMAFSVLSSDEFINFTNGKGFRNNEAVYARFQQGKYSKSGIWQQDALDYFGFEGTFDPQYFLDTNNKNPAATLPEVGITYYNKNAFDHGFGYLYAAAQHESIHRDHIFEGVANSRTGNNFEQKKWKEEYETYVQQYKQEGLYYPHPTYNIPMRINVYGTSLEYDDDKFLQYTGFLKRPFLHTLYKIPRRW